MFLVGCTAQSRDSATDNSKTGQATPAAQKADPPSWSTLGEPFLSAYCIRCHTDPPTGGAPNTIQTLEQARQNIQGIYQRVVFTDNMPPDPPFPTANEEDQLRMWLELGAPR